LLSAEKPYTEESGWGTTFAYTYTDAKQNHIHIDDCCAFDEKDRQAIPHHHLERRGLGIASWPRDPYAVRGK